MPVSLKTEKYIWGLFAGRCAICRELLVHDGTNGERSLIGETAHIVGEKPTAARGHHPLKLSARNEPDNLLLLCRKHHKIIDDNENVYSLTKLHGIRKDHLEWLRFQLEPANPWQINVSAFVYLNVPRLGEYAAIQGFRVSYPGPRDDQSLYDLGIELNHLISAYKLTLENLPIAAVPAERISFLHEGYTGGLLAFDKLRFRTKNIRNRSRGGKDFHFTGNQATDPHIYHAFPSWTLVLNIDPRWITTSTASTLFRPSASHSIFTGFARINHVDLENMQVTATALAIGIPLSDWDLLQSHVRSDNDWSAIPRTFRTNVDGRHTSVVNPSAPIDFQALEDDATKSRQEIWHGKLEHCEFCGRAFKGERYMIDGPMMPGGPWGCMCIQCYSKKRMPLGVGKGQLYRLTGKVWTMVGGYSISDMESDG